MFKNLLAFTFLLLYICNSYAGTPSATDSTRPLPRPTQYMSKYLNVDRTNMNTNSPNYVVTITALNTATTNNCTSAGTATTTRGINLTGIQYVQIGVFGQVPSGTYLNDTNLYNWRGNLWTRVRWTSCSSGCCTNNCPYWIYDYSQLRIICAPMFTDWRTNNL